VREVQQPGWTQTYALPVLVDPQGNPYNVIVPASGSAVANFGNQSAVALPGDFNRDETVDMADWLMHRKTINMAVANAYDGADGNGDGTITEADLAVWTQNFGRTLSGSGGGGETLLAGEEGGSGGVAAAVASSDLVIADATDLTADSESAADATLDASSSAQFASFGFASVAPAKSASSSVSSLLQTSSNPAGEAAIIAWLNSLENSDHEIGADEFAVSNLSDNGDGEAGDDIESLDAIFDLIGV
jgi:hypothetical protein